MSKLTRTEADRQAARLLANPMLVPQTEQGQNEITDCLMRNCQTAEHAAAVMTQFLDTARDPRNVTAELAAIARATQQTDQAPAGCDRCVIGEDVNTGEMRWANHVSRERKGISCAMRCDCERGQWLAAKDAERKAVQPEPRKPAQRLERAAEDWQRRAAGDGA